MMWSLDFASAFPARTVEAAEIASWTGGDEKFLREKLGISRRHFLAPDENPLDLARAAAEKALAKSVLQAEQLDFLVYVTQNPDFRLPQSSALLTAELKARSDIASFDLSLGCSGWVYGLSLAEAFAQREGFKHGLVVTCDPYSRGIARNDKSTVSVFGDAAAATVFRPGGSVTIGKCVFGTDGSGGMGLAARCGGARQPVVSIDTESETVEVRQDDFRIQMDGRAILDFMLSRVPAAVEDCVLRNGLQLQDIDIFVFHQASKYMLELLTRRMQIDPSKVPIELEDTGNTVSSTIPIVLERLQDRGLLQGNVVVCGFGVGLSWAASVLRFPITNRV